MHQTRVGSSSSNKNKKNKKNYKVINKQKHTQHDLVGVCVYIYMHIGCWEFHGIMFENCVGKFEKLVRKIRELTTDTSETRQKIGNIRKHIR